MIKKISPFLLLFAFLSIPSATAPAEDQIPPGRALESPYDFQLGTWNDDQKYAVAFKSTQLQGFRSFEHKEEVSPGGYPPAKHANCLESEYDRRWTLHGTNPEAALVLKGPGLWLVDPTDIPPQPTFNHSQQLGQPAGEGTKAR